MPQKPEMKTKYTLGEKLLCYHGPLLYEAKCMEIQEGVETRYLIHYQGWNKTWDEWVNDTRILKFNEAGIKKQKELQDQYRESRKKKDGKKKLLPDKRKQNRNASDKQRFIGSASETSNRSFGESEDGKTSKFTTEDDNLEIRTEAGTSVMSGEDLDEQRSIIIRDKSIGSSSKGGGRSKKRRLSNSDTTGGERIDEKILTEEEINYTINNINNNINNNNNNNSNNANNNNNNNHNEATNSNRSTNSSKSKKSRLVPLDESVVDLEAYVTGINCQTLKFVFSDNLRMWLADDWDLITRQSRLTRIPTRMSVDNVLTKYRAYCEQLTLEDGENENLFSKNREMRLEFVEGVRKYFNTAVGSQLLYKFERQQYFEIVNGNNDLKLEMSSVYGSMYVLRLLVSFNKLISYTRTDMASADCLSELIQHFIEYLDSNADEFFKLEDYITATADYTRRAMC